MFQQFHHDQIDYSTNLFPKYHEKTTKHQLRSCFGDMKLSNMRLILRFLKPTNQNPVFQNFKVKLCC
jgi:hypothetical protein